MSKFGITARIAGGFGAIIILLVIVSLSALFGIQTLSDVAAKYRFANAQAGEISDYVADYDRMVLEVQKYLLEPSADAATEARLWIDDVATNDPDGVAKFDSLPVARSEISKIEVSATALRDAFDKLIELEGQHAALLSQVSEAQSKFHPLVTALIDGGERSLSADVTTKVARAVQASMSTERAASEYLFDDAQTLFDEAQATEKEALTRLDELQATPAATGLSKDIGELRSMLEVFGSAVTQTATIAAEVKKITDEELLVHSKELSDSYAVLTSEVRSNQEALGPLSEQSASTTQLIVSIVAGLAVLIGIGLAYVTGTWLSKAIGKMSHDMSRMADGDLDLELGPAPKAAELGLMARALETFRINGIAMRSMDAEKEQAREKERAEQEIRSQLQKEVAEVVSAAVAGDFSRRIESRYDEDDLNALASAVNSLVETVDRGVGESGRVLAALANTDLTHRVTGDYQGAFDNLKRDTNAVADKLTEVVGQIKETSRGLKVATGEILSGANDLSERTTKQAATIEETSAAMEQLAHTVMGNAKKAGSASEQANVASRTAEEGGEVMQAANQAMERISNSSAKISNIIGMIDDIAFQTNLLALNASVEAARAGEAGKGFAVVAVEVRRLAQSAAEASAEVKVLIEQSGEEVAGGTKLVAEAAEKLSAILDAVRINATEMEEIARDSREQASSIEEVNTAVRQMDEMTQHNAALVEQTNAAIEQTESQASELDNIVDVFTLADTGISMTSKKAAAPAAAKGGVKDLQRKVVGAAKAYLSKGNAAVKTDTDWSEF